MIIFINLIISALNSFSLSNKVVDDINYSALVSVNKIITQLLKPICINDDNCKQLLDLLLAH
ncbi:MAG: hypothetical protein ACTS73_00845 [Arsenophonus sp. NEOnobi-MAG3]